MVSIKQCRVFGIALAATAAMGFAAASQAQIVKIDGSSTVFPITEAVAEDFQKAKKGKVKVTVGISGTGGGFRKSAKSLLTGSATSHPRSRMHRTQPCADSDAAASSSGAVTVTHAFKLAKTSRARRS